MKANAILITATILVALMIIIALTPTNIPYDVDNPYWDGYSIAAKVCGLRQIYQANSINDYSQIFLIPQVPPSQSLIRQLSRFVANGGRLVVLSNSVMYGNSVLRELGVGVEIGNGTVVDFVFNLGNPYMPLCYVRNTTLINEPLVLALDNASPLIVGGNAVVIAFTSSLSSASSSVGSFPVIAYVKYGRGYVIVISTPAVFTNSLIHSYNNTEFLRALCINETNGIIETTLANHNAQLMLRGILLEVYGILSMRPINYIISIIPLIAASLIIAKYKNV